MCKWTKSAIPRNIVIPFYPRRTRVNHFFLLFCKFSKQTKLLWKEVIDGVIRIERKKWCKPELMTSKSVSLFVCFFFCSHSIVDEFRQVERRRSCSIFHLSVKFVWINTRWRWAEGRQMSDVILFLLILHFFTFHFSSLRIRVSNDSTNCFSIVFFRFISM